MTPDEQAHAPQRDAMTQALGSTGLNRRRLLGGIGGVAGLFAIGELFPQAASAETPAYQVVIGGSRSQQILGPATPADTANWLEAMKAWRQSEHARFGYDPSNYARPELQWAQSNPMQPQTMIEDRYLYDPAKQRYTVDRYLDDVTRRFGGIDSILLWPTYPNIGVDNRNTVEMIRDMPGGFDGVRKMVAEFQARGVRVLFPIMSWDYGSHDPGASTWADVLPRVMAQIGADGLNGDVLSIVTKDYFDNSLAAGRPLVLEPELGLGNFGTSTAAAGRAAVGWNTMSWGYWTNDAAVPMVSANKWLEPRHTVHVNDRWSKSKIDLLHSAFFNGTGLSTWENIWGIWNGMTERDGEATRRVAEIERKFPKLLVSSKWEPHTPTRQAGVYASKWPSETGSQTLWTIVNRDANPRTGAQLEVDYSSGIRYYDVWSGVELKPEVTGNRAVLSFTIEGKGFGAVLASTTADLPRDFDEFQRTMNKYAKRPLSSYSAANFVLPQTMTKINTTGKAQQAPAGMVYIPAANYRFAVRGVEIEGGILPGVGVQFPGEAQPSRYHALTINIAPFYIDKTPVTNEQFQRFMDATNYRPEDSHNFLAHWDWSANQRPKYKAGWAKKPVTFVSIEDARAYAKWAKARLPHSYEWQYAAQGLDNRSYPWGRTFDATRVPATFSGRDELRPPDDVDAHPSGASPFGVLDLVGNVWQWTDEFTDEHTRTAVLRGGSYYRALGSTWYFPSNETAYRLDHQSKYLLMAPGRDRAATIGFRTVVDAAQPAPTAVDNGTIVDDNAPGWRFNGWNAANDVDNYNGAYHGGAGTGNWAEYTFTGTGVDVYGWRGPNGGVLRVLVDGVVQGGPISLSRATAIYNELLVRAGGLADGTHTLRIEADASSPAAAVNRVDYLRVYTSHDTQPPAPPALTLSSSSAAAGSTVTVQVRLRNESAAAVSGQLRLAADAPLTVAPAALPIGKLAPHAEVTGEFVVTVPAGTIPGDKLLRAVAELDKAANAEGWTTLQISA
ncbi:SUMF1/EgtB/PvdO family nonheme iron enzyme [Dactylosporangium sp. NPDC051485]|uniref:SUMF1/EgtB/PvdO family nonheme iron enzyme n=1 Tax=Dactylosporangium sp. NPDC051485 TaxID=3154846 RepID=UPI00342677EB